jgi:hypothetical protein
MSVARGGSSAEVLRKLLRNSCVTPAEFVANRASGTIARGSNAPSLAAERVNLSLAALC